jgi:hypothetical protein
MMSEKQTEYHARMARAMPDELAAMRDFFYGLQEQMETSGPSEVYDWLEKNFPKVDGTGTWERVIYGYETMFDNACDPSLSYLDWNKDLKAAMAAYSPTPGGETMTDGRK